MDLLWPKATAIHYQIARDSISAREGLNLNSFDSNACCTVRLKVDVDREECFVVPLCTVSPI